MRLINFLFLFRFLGKVAKKEKGEIMGFEVERERGNNSFPANGDYNTNVFSRHVLLRVVAFFPSYPWWQEKGLLFLSNQRQKIHPDDNGLPVKKWKGHKNISPWPYR